MVIKERNLFSLFMGGRCPEGGWGETIGSLSSKRDLPPIDLRCAPATSPRKRGEDSTSQALNNASTSSRILTNSALRYFRSPGQKIRDALRA